MPKVEWRDRNTAKPIVFDMSREYNRLLNGVIRANSWA